MSDENPNKVPEGYKILGTIFYTEHMMIPVKSVFEVEKKYVEKLNNTLSKPVFGWRSEKPEVNSVDGDLIVSGEMSVHESDFDLAMKIVDGMSDEDKELLGFRPSNEERKKR